MYVIIKAIKTISSDSDDLIIQKYMCFIAQRGCNICSLVMIFRFARIFYLNNTNILNKYNCLSHQRLQLGMPDLFYIDIHSMFILCPLS